MSGRGAIFLIEPDKWAVEAEEVSVDEGRPRALIDHPDPEMPDDQSALALIDLLRDEVAERVEGEDGLLGVRHLVLAFEALLATAARLGWATLPDRTE